MKSILLVFCFSLIISALGIFFSRRPPKWYKNNLVEIVSVGLGILLSIVCFEFFPRILSTSNSSLIDFKIINKPSVAGLGFLAGLGTIMIFERYLAPLILIKGLSDASHSEDLHCHHDHKHNEHEHCDHRHEHHLITHHSACSAVGCLLLCAFFDGMQITAAIDIDTSTGLLLMGALFFHVLPDSVLVAGIIESSKIKKFKSLFGGLVGGSLLLGSLTAQFLGKAFPGNPLLLAFISGIIVYVGLIHLLPIAAQKKHYLLWMGLGVLLFNISHELLVHSGHQH